jgi:hypothetical protein
MHFLYAPLFAQKKNYSCKKWVLLHPSQVCPWQEAQIRLLRHLTRTRDGALNFMLKIVEFLQATPSAQLS